MASTGLEYNLHYDSLPVSKRIEASLSATTTKDRTKKNIRGLEEMKNFQGRDINWRDGINVPDPDSGLTPLLLAVLQDKKELVIALLERGAEIEFAENKKGRTALHLASRIGHVDILLELCKRGSVANSTDDYSKTPLMHASKAGYVSCAKALLQYGAAVNMTDSNGFTALHYASHYGHEDVVRVLLDARATVEVRDNIDGLTALHFASQYGRKECVLALLDIGGAKVNRRSAKDKVTSLMVAAREGNKSICSILLARGADANLYDTYGWTALHYAASWGRRDTAHIIIVEGSANVNIRPTPDSGSGGCPPVIVAARAGHVEVINLLAQYGADIDLPELELGNTALTAAAALDLVDVIFALVNLHANVNRPNHITGTTALMNAAANGSRGSMIILLNQLADLNILDKTGKTALEHATENGHRLKVLTAIAQTSPISKVNLLPWLVPVASTIPLDRDSKLGGPGNYLYDILLSSRGLFRGLLALSGDCDCYIPSALMMIISAADAAHKKSQKDFFTIRDIISSAEKMLIEFTKSRAIQRYDVLLDSLITGQSPCQELLKLTCSCANLSNSECFCEGRLFLSALHSGPLAQALDIGEDLGCWLCLSTLQEKIDSATFCSSRAPALAVDGYGLISRFNLFRYIPAFSIIGEAVGHVLYLLCVAVRCAQHNSDGQYFSTVDLLLALLTISKVFYEIGLMEEKRWAISPDIVYYFAQLERKRWKAVKSHFFATTWKFLDFVTCCTSVGWLSLRICTRCFSSTRTLATYNATLLLLSVSAIPCSFGLLRYPAFFNPQFGIELQLLILALCNIYQFAFFYSALGLGFGISLLYLNRASPDFSTPYNTFVSFLEVVTLRSSYIAHDEQSPQTFAVWLMIVFVLFSGLFLFPALISSLSCSYARLRERAVRLYAVRRASTLQQNSVVLERSALCILPPPLNLLGVLVYPFHIYFIWRAKITAERARVQSVAGLTADFFVALLTLLPCAVYEQMNVAFQGDSGIIRRIWSVISSVLGIPYCCICLFWKLLSDPAPRLLVKSRISDGRLKLSHGRIRDTWEMNALSQFADPRLHFELRRFPGKSQEQSKEEYFELLAAQATSGFLKKRIKPTLLDDYEIDDIGFKSNKYSGDNLSGEERKFGNSEKSEEDATNSSHDEFGELSSLSMKPTVSNRSKDPFQKRPADLRGRQIRVQFGSPWLQIAHIGRLDDILQATSAVAPLMPYLGESSDLIDSTALQELRQMRVKSRYIGSEESTSHVAVDNELLSQDDNHPDILWSSDAEANSQSDEALLARLNPYQPGITSNKHWQELAAEMEPKSPTNQNIPKPISESLQANNKNKVSAKNTDSIKAESMYFRTSIFPPVLSVVERRNVFSIALPEFFPDEFTYAVRRTEARMAKLELLISRLEHQRNDELNPLREVTNI